MGSLNIPRWSGHKHGHCFLCPLDWLPQKSDATHQWTEGPVKAPEDALNIKQTEIRLAHEWSRTATV
jgi:hypothetical protein